MKRGSTSARTTAPRVLLVGGIVVLAGCSALLDWDLSKNYGASDSFEAGPAEDGGADQEPEVKVIPTDGSSVIDDASSDAGRPSEAGVLDCDGAILCDGFESWSTGSGPPLVGAWSFNASNNGGFSVASGGAIGASALLFDSPAQGGGGIANNFIGATGLPLGSNRTIRASFDVMLTYDATAFPSGSPSAYRVIFDTNPDASSGETAGLYINKQYQLYAVLRTFPSGSTDIVTSLTDLGVDLKNTFHRVDFEVVFSTSPAQGKLVVFVDGRVTISLTNQRTLTTLGSSKFDIAFGTTPGNNAPASIAKFDNIQVRSR